MYGRNNNKIMLALVFTSGIKLSAHLRLSHVLVTPYFMEDEMIFLMYIYCVLSSVMFGWRKYTLRY